MTRKIVIDCSATPPTVKIDGKLTACTIELTYAVAERYPALTVEALKLRVKRIRA